MEVIERQHREVNAIERRMYDLHFLRERDMPGLAGPHGSTGFVQTEKGTREKLRPEPLLGFLWDKQSRASQTV